VALTPGNIDDRKPVPDLLRELFGKIFGVSEASGVWTKELEKSSQ